jgi:hypothetical protein
VALVQVRRAGLGRAIAGLGEVARVPGLAADKAGGLEVVVGARRGGARAPASSTCVCGGSRGFSRVVKGGPGSAKQWRQASERDCKQSEAEEKRQGEAMQA